MYIYHLEPVPDFLHRRIRSIVYLHQDDIAGAREALAHIGAVKSIAQLGTRLHALLDRSTPDPQRVVQGAFERAHVQARVELTKPSLEDVFVAATLQGQGADGRPKSAGSAEKSQ